MVSTATATGSVLSVWIRIWTVATRAPLGVWEKPEAVVAVTLHGPYAVPKGALAWPTNCHCTSGGGGGTLWLVSVPHWPLLADAVVVAVVWVGLGVGLFSMSECMPTPARPIKATRTSRAEAMKAGWAYQGRRAGGVGLFKTGTPIV
jgi:hypothetical protein